MKMLSKDMDGLAQRLGKYVSLCVAAALLLAISMTPLAAQAAIQRLAGIVNLEDNAAGGGCVVTSLGNFSVDYDSDLGILTNPAFLGTVHSNPVTGQRLPFGMTAPASSRCVIARGTALLDLQLVPMWADIFYTQTDGLYGVYFALFSHTLGQYFEIEIQGNIYDSNNAFTRQVVVRRGGQWIGTKNSYAKWYVQ